LAGDDADEELRRSGEDEVGLLGGARVGVDAPSRVSTVIASSPVRNSIVTGGSSGVRSLSRRLASQRPR
jgi:hypothetical protein